MNFEVYLKRKPSCSNDAQAARKRVAHVVANNVEEAKKIALALPQNAAFVIDGTPRRSK